MSYFRPTEEPDQDLGREPQSILLLFSPTSIRVHGMVSFIGPQPLGFNS